LAVAKFGLVPVPDDALASSPALRALHDDEAAWTAYAKARKLPLTRRRPRDDNGDDGDDGDDSDDEEDAHLRKRVVAATRRHLAKSGVAPPTRKLLLSQLDAFYDAEIDEDFDDVRTLSAETTLWSPWALPTGLSLSCNYLCVPRNESVDFELSLRSRLAPAPRRARAPWAPLLSVRWDWEAGRRHRRVGRRHRDDESLFDASDEDEGESDSDASDSEDGWGGGSAGGELVKVETAHSPGLTPATGRRWREAVGGPGGALLPVDAVPDYALVSAAVRAGMADGATAAAKQTGHVWRASAADAAAMKAAGVWATVLTQERMVGREREAAEPFSPDCIQRDWWEVAIRRATGAARAADAYYRETSDVEA